MHAIESVHDDSRISRPHIVQGCFAIRNLQLSVGKHPEDKVSEKKLRALEAKYRQAIQAAGGVEAIDEWLSVNDPRHSRLCEFDDIDWSFLTAIETE